MFIFKDKRQKTKDKKTKDKRQKTKDKRQKTKDKRQKTKDKRQKTKKIKSKIKVIINETRLGGLEFAVSIIKLGKKLNKTYEGRHIYGQLFRAGTSNCQLLIINCLLFPYYFL